MKSFTIFRLLLLFSLLTLSPALRAQISGGGSPIFGSGAGGGSGSASGVFFVDDSGNDNGAGSQSNPFATLENAVERLGGSGTVIIREGTYTSGVSLEDRRDITLIAYPGERVEFHLYDHAIASNSFAALSNGIFTVTMSSGFSNALTYLTNIWDANPPTDRGIFLFQTNKPFGAQTVGQFFIPVVSNRRGETNRCEHTPLIRAASISAMTNQDACWQIQGSTLYVRFGVSNVAGGLVLSSTNPTRAVIYGAAGTTRVKVSGIRSLFGWNGFDFTGCSEWEFKGCHAFGNGRSGFFGDCSEVQTGSGRIVHCEGAGMNQEGFEFLGSNNSAEWPYVEQVGCVWHDYLREASRVAFGVSETVIGSTAFGHFGQFGFISDGAHSTYVGCQTLSNSVAGTQLGEAAVAGHTSYQRSIGGRAIADSAGFQLNDFRNNVIVQNAYVRLRIANSQPVNVVNNPATSYVEAIDSMNDNPSGGVNFAFIQGADVSLHPTRYIEASQGMIGQGIYARSIALGGATSLDGSTFGNLRVFGGSAEVNIFNDGAVATAKSNLLSAASITVTGSPFSWTNSTLRNLTAYVDGGTVSAIAVNGTTIFTATGKSVLLQKNEYVTVTYSVAPTMFWKPF